MSEVPVSAASESVFDVQRLLKYMGGDGKAQAVVGKIVGDAFAGAGTAVQSACAAARTGRYAEAARAFHVLRGTVGTVGTRRFVSAALAVEVVML